ncbi:MAG: pilus assembly protein TadG-related protein [Phascolarctobacterium sp.]
MNKTYLYTKFRSFQRGAIMVLFAVLLPVLFGFMGFSIDLGLAYVEHGKMQDIADAAALAGAAHLGDSDRDTTVKDAVKAYVEANGIKLGANDLMNKADGSAWDAKDTLAKGQDALVSYGIVSVTKDGETRDRVRVRITKRAPLFFFNVLGDFSDGLVVAAKAAAEGGSVAQPAAVEGGNPVFMCSVIQMHNTRADQIKITNNSFPVYVKGDMACFDKLPGTGTVYANSISGSGVGSWKYNYKTNAVEFDPPLPNGRTWICTNGNSTVKNGGTINDPGSDDPDYDILMAQKNALHEEYVDIANKMNDQYSKIVEEGKDKASEIRNSKQEYIDGVKNGTNKRYIGLKTNPDRPWEQEAYTTILDTDTEIDLYMDATAMLHKDSSWLQSRNVLTNLQLKNVKKINNLYMSSSQCLISTDSITYGNVYVNGAQFTIAGNNNTFNGTVYAQIADGGQCTVGGNKNSFVNKYGKPSIVTQQLYIGVQFMTSTSNIIQDENGNTVDKMTMSDNWNYVANDPDWEVTFGTEGGSVSSGSGTEGTETTTKLKLVE